jgi:hypothetical protein
MPAGRGTNSLSENGSTSKVYCANCYHCKLILVRDEAGGGYFRRVRCAAGHWRKKLGGEKIYKYFTVTRRLLTDCRDYSPMGDPKDFLHELKETLPIKDEQITL